MNLLLKTKIFSAGKSQVLLARESQVSEAQFSRIVSGWIEPCEEVKGKIAKALGCSVDEIFPKDKEERISCGIDSKIQP